MKKILITGTLSLAVAMGGLMISCGDFLEIEPLNAVVVENYWEKKGDVESVISSCYYHMQDNGFSQRVIAWGELRGDNVTDVTNMPNNKELYDYFVNNITADNSWMSWSDFYNVINLCNTVLYYAPEAQAKDGNYSMEELHTHEAEVKSIRALCYFYLIRTFKKVPLVTQATIGDDEDFKVGADDEETVLQQIIGDLEWAKSYIWDKRYFEDWSSRKGRFNKLSVKALLADIYLWKGDYERAATYSKEIIDEKKAEYDALQKSVEEGNYNMDAYMQGELALYNGYPLLVDAVNDNLHYSYNQLFGTGNGFESIFELQYDREVRKNNEGVNYFYGPHEAGKAGWVSAADYLVNQDGGSPFDKVDKRLEENTGYDGTVILNSYPVYKFRALFNNDNTAYMRGTVENWIVYRLTDVMLMRAEALAYMGGEENLKEAFALVEAVNMRSCMGRKTLTYDEETMKTLVLDERQRELMFEGKRWYDLVRMVRHAENPVKAMSTLRNTYLMRKYTSGGRDAVARMGSLDNLYLPFYQKEIDVNPLLEKDQNPAYIIY